MMVSNLYRGQAKKHNTFRTGFIGTAILTVLWVVLSLFAIPCTGVEAAVRKPEEIQHLVHDKAFVLRIVLMKYSMDGDD